MSGKGDPPKSILKKSVKINLGEHTREENPVSRDLSQKSLSVNVRERIVSSWYQASQNIFLITLNKLYIYIDIYLDLPKEGRKLGNCWSK